jgi:hypothetical protein
VNVNDNANDRDKDNNTKDTKDIRDITTNPKQNKAKINNGSKTKTPNN